VGAYVGAKILLRILDRAVEVAGLTMEQVENAIKDAASVSDSINEKVQQFMDYEWIAKTDIPLELVLKVYYRLLSALIQTR
jgi:hypothetical protein